MRAADGGRGRGPAGWPAALPPPQTAEFEQRVPGWLLELCPPRYRDHVVLRRQPRVLAWLATRHVIAQAAVVADALATARADLVDAVDARVVGDVIDALELESAALLADVRAVRLVTDALSGVRFVPRL